MIRTKQYANGKVTRNNERTIGPIFLNSTKNDTDVNITKTGSLQIFHLKIKEHDGTFECDTVSGKRLVVYPLSEPQACNRVNLTPCPPHHPIKYPLTNAGDERR